MKVAYLHILPLEYYPPACTFLDTLAAEKSVDVRVYTTCNLRGRKPYCNKSVTIDRGDAPNPGALRVLRLLTTIKWHVKTAFSLRRFQPDSIVYVEPHSAIAAWLFLRFFSGKARLYVHHHEFYEQRDFLRPGMQLPRIGNLKERQFLFPRAEWISQTNEDRLRLAMRDNPAISDTAWRVLPNYPPAEWCTKRDVNAAGWGQPVRLIYVGSASFEDTYIQEITRWASRYPKDIQLHICGYNVKADVFEWLDQQRFSNVTYEPDGCAYEELPSILTEFDIGLVLYKGNTTNFVFNIPNKVYEYLCCGLEVWYPTEMTSIKKFQGEHSLPLRELDFSNLVHFDSSDLQPLGRAPSRARDFTAEQAFDPLLAAMGVNERRARI
ncbi:hypothetical protein [Elongatibacter sediminis]|uniref:hypothetical protein n=1 Tax=Elongatibacter sediminis TaxID=3119006 RepID=UPI00339D5B5F